MNSDFGTNADAEIVALNEAYRIVSQAKRECSMAAGFAQWRFLAHVLEHLSDRVDQLTADVFAVPEEQPCLSQRTN